MKVRIWGFESQFISLLPKTGEMKMETKILATITISVLEDMTLQDSVKIEQPELPAQKFAELAEFLSSLNLNKEDAPKKKTGAKKGRPKKDTSEETGNPDEDTMNLNPKDQDNQSVSPSKKEELANKPLIKDDK
jgi:hypothetical protein